jgi:hypothetical protein
VQEVGGTGIATGSIPGHHMFPLLVKLYFSLVPSATESVLPSTIVWWKEYVVMPDDPDQDNHINIFQTVVSCITSCMDFYHLSVSHCLDYEGLEAHLCMTGNMRTHMTMLFHLRSCLIRSLKKKQQEKEDQTERKKAAKKLKKDQQDATLLELENELEREQNALALAGKVPNTLLKKKRQKENATVEEQKKPKFRQNLNTEILFKALKPHLCEHMTKNFMHFGATVITSDTQRSESELKYVCKDLFDQTNRTYKNLQQQLMEAFVKNLRASELAKCFERRRAASRPATVVEKVPDVRVSFVNYGHIEICQDNIEVWGRKLNSQMEMSYLDSDLDSVHVSLTAQDVIDVILNAPDLTVAIVRIKHIIANQHLHVEQDLKIQLFKGIVISNLNHWSDNTAEAIPFTLHCSRQYRMSQTSESRALFSFVEVSFSDKSLVYCQVAAIARVSTKADKAVNLLVIRLKPSRKTSPLPFGLFKYELRRSNKKLCYDLVSINNIRPCIAVRYEEEPNTSVKQQQFFIIPYDRIGKIPNPSWQRYKRRLDIYEEDSRQDVKSSSFPLFKTEPQQIEALAMIRTPFLPETNVGTKRKSMID